MALSKKAESARRVLEAGGHWLHRLEDGWHGAKFAYVLRTAKGSKLSGYAVKTFFELDDAGLIERVDSGPAGSRCVTKYELKKAAPAGVPIYAEQGWEEF